VKPYQKYLTHKRAGGVAEVVKHLYTYSPEFKLQYHQKIEKSKEFLLCERYFLKSKRRNQSLRENICKIYN
jgi:hypothetical protein